MSRKIDIKCPYCSFINGYKITNFYNPKQVITCDYEEGGCDRSFVMDINVSVEVKTFKIEGEE